MASAVNILSWVFVVLGCYFVIAGAIGIVRMPDVFTRIHAASLIDTGGVIFIALGLLLQAIFVFENPMAAIKLVLLVIFIHFTSPAASHAIAKVALMMNVIPIGKGGESVVCESLQPSEGSASESEEEQ